MPICNKCNESFPNRIQIDGKYRNICNRKYCLTCSPFGVHNTKQLHLPKKVRKKYDANYIYRKGRRLEHKKALLEIVGNKCSNCVYDKCIGAIDFHHKDPSTKLFEISKALYSRGCNSLVQEVMKTVPLCRNCHAEIHYSYPLLSSSLVQDP